MRVSGIGSGDNDHGGQILPKNILKWAIIIKWYESANPTPPKKKIKKLRNGNCKLLKVFKLKLNILSTMNEPSLAQDLRPEDNEET